MSAKAILEADGKAILNYHLTRSPLIKPSPLAASSTHNPPPKLAILNFPEDADIAGVLDQAEQTYPWLLKKEVRFVAKPDQLIKRRGKSGLLALNKTWPEARAWVEARAKKAQRVGGWCPEEFLGRAVCAPSSRYRILHLHPICELFWDHGQEPRVELIEKLQVREVRE
jgi:hypothetical protein